MSCCHPPPSAPQHCHGPLYPMHMFAVCIQGWELRKHHKTPHKKEKHACCRHSSSQAVHKTANWDSWWSQWHDESLKGLSGTACKPKICTAATAKNETIIAAAWQQQIWRRVWWDETTADFTFTVRHPYLIVFCYSSMQYFFSKTNLGGDSQPYIILIPKPLHSSHGQENKPPPVLPHTVFKYSWLARPSNTNNTLFSAWFYSGDIHCFFCVVIFFFF